MMYRSSSEKGPEKNIASNLKAYAYRDASQALQHKTWSSYVDTFTSSGVCVIDANGDGLPDIFIPGLGAFNTSLGVLNGIKDKDFGNRLFLNKGNDSLGLPIFEEVTDKAGIRNIGKLGVGCAVADYDNDGREDVVVTNATKGAFYSAYGETPIGFGKRVTPPSFFYTDKTDGKYNFPAEGGVTLFSNVGNDKNGIPHFKNVTMSAGLTHGGNGTSAVWGDVNNDGFIDLFVANYSDFDFVGFTTPHFAGEENVLYKNNGDGTFMDVTKESGVAGKPDYVYQRNGEKLYSWDKNIVDSKGRVVGDSDGNNTLAASFIYNNKNGLPDLITGDDIPGRIRMYKNLGSFHFKDVSDENNFGISGAWMGIAAGDVNGDGSEDIFATNLGSAFGSRYRPQSDTETEMYDILNPPNRGTFYNGLWLSQDNFYKNVSQEVHVDWRDLIPNIRWFPPDTLSKGTIASPKPVGLELGDFGFGALIFDYNNDGKNDIMWIGSLLRSGINLYINFSGTGHLLQNVGDGKMVDISDLVGVRDLTSQSDQSTYQNGRGLAIADFNSDGYNDIIMTNAGGFDSGDPNVPKLPLGLNYLVLGLAKEYRPGPTFLFISNGGTNHWIKIKLIGAKSNKSAIGAKIYIEYKENGVVKKQFRAIHSGGSYASQNSLESIFGLGASAEIDRVTVEWPSGIVQKIVKTKANQRITIKEP
ncbi:MAG: CRTAC1 family protein [Candidatus Liptonbacteria bacterium]|nr:CRTAC1 family protein [Candidatus Liptonbacteria bacterium]